MGSLAIPIESIKENQCLNGKKEGKLWVIILEGLLLCFCCNLECLSMGYACVMCPMLLMFSFEYVCALL